MSFNFGAPKTDGTPAGFSFPGTGAGDAKPAQANKPQAFGLPTPHGGFSMPTVASTGGPTLNLSNAAPAGGFSFGAPAAPTASTLGSTPLSFGAAPPSTAPTFGLTGATSTFGAPPSSAPPTFGTPGSTAPAPGSFGATAAAAPTPSMGLFGSSASGGATLGSSFASPATAAPPTSAPILGAFSLAQSSAPSATGFSLTAAPATPSTTGFNLLGGSSGVSGVSGGGVSTGFSLGGSPAVASSAPTASVAPSLNFGVTPASSTSAVTSSSGFSLPSLTPKTGASTTTTAPALGFSLATSSVASTLSSLPGPATSSTALTSALPATGTLSFAQLEDAINKWTIDLEEQSKLFGNQAKQLNAWDRLLVSNGEKVLSLNNGIERVKQQQQQLDQELDFVLAQQKELEDLITPLEKELNDVPVTDMDRHQTYQLAENIDTQLKQMSEDLKEIIEQLNESNKGQENSNPITQIRKILNAHMNSLQWIDSNTSKITTHLDQISKMHDLHRKNHENTLKKIYN